jgi:hypothetical protein
MISLLWGAPSLNPSILARAALVCLAVFQKFLPDLKYRKKNMICQIIFSQKQRNLSFYFKGL